MRKQIAAGNWKMNMDYQTGLELASAIISFVPSAAHQQVVLCTPFIHLRGVAELVKGLTNVFVAAQNVYTQPSGAFTGEVSASMIASTGATHVIIGHSERREYFEESNTMLVEKVNIALANKLTPIFCCGESLSIRDGGVHISFVCNQIKESLFHLNAEEFSKVIIAYEPIWAIGTGVTATPDQAQEMQHEIRQFIAANYGDTIAENISILYGGSVKPNNAAVLFGCQDVDGGLIGGASLDAAGFIEIIKALR